MGAVLCVITKSVVLILKATRYKVAQYPVCTGLAN